MKQILLLAIFLTSLLASFVYATGEIGDLYFYKVTSGQEAQAQLLLAEGRALGAETGMVIIIHKQNFGDGGDSIFSWFELYENQLHRAETQYKDSRWAAYLGKFYRSTAITPVRSFTMTALDELVQADYIVNSYIWDPKPGKYDETLKAMYRTKAIFEKHGFQVDLWVHGAGSDQFLNFTMLSTSLIEQAKSMTSLAADPDWLKLEPSWMKNEKYARLVENYQMTSTALSD